jgi:predicted adenine nucleotide alpha hydrolase (AANH) superfamily ATPase
MENIKSEDLKLVLMSCCAPCSAGAIRQLHDAATASRIADFTVLFYNPNIFPESEYQKRLAEQIKLCESLGAKYEAFDGDWDAEHKKWLSRVRGLESEPERGARCAECFKMRLAFGAKWAREHGCNAIATVFGVSRHKDQSQADIAARFAIKADDIRLAASKNLIQSGNETEQKYPPLQYLSITWDENLRIAENKKHGFYRQKYCGCEFSAPALRK